MCGIFLIFSKTGFFTTEYYNQILNAFNKIKHRGPDDSSITIAYNSIIGFHRLAINDLTKNGMQPFITKNIDQETNFTICNGEIYNYDTLLENNNEIKKLLKSKSDCEILPHLYQKYGFTETIKMLDAVFATCYITPTYIQVASDKIGVKPVFYAENDKYFGICSEAKGLDSIFEYNEIKRLTPGTILTYNLTDFYKDFNKYWSVYQTQTVNLSDSFTDAIEKTKSLLINSVKKRMTSDREIGCLLSGGLDSSICAAILQQELKKEGKVLTTFSVGFSDSTDLIYAKQVADFISSNHIELILDHQSTLEKIPKIIQQIETYDTTTIRASTPMYLLCEYISNNFPHKVIFSGEGSDEVNCSYLYFHNSPSIKEGHDDSLRLIDELYLYDVLRSDRTTSGNGLEFREPFLDIEYLTYTLQLNPEYILPQNHKMEKILLRTAFKDYLPESVVWRQKEAFSDGVSNSKVKAWYKYIQEYAKTQTVNDYRGTVESNWYKTVFYNYFNNYRPIINLWLPRWTNVGSEPSATVLNVYKTE